DRGAAVVRQESCKGSGAGRWGGPNARLPVCGVSQRQRAGRIALSAKGAAHTGNQLVVLHRPRTHGLEPRTPQGALLDVGKICDPDGTGEVARHVPRQSPDMRARSIAEVQVGNALLKSVTVGQHGEERVVALDRPANVRVIEQ